jgi:hypothetical protein
VPPDVSGSIAINGADATVTTTVAGQNASLTFSGTAGQRVALQALSDTYPSYFSVTLYKPAADGSASTANGFVYSSTLWNTGSWTDVQTLPIAGTYTIVINPSVTNTGSATFRLWSVPPDVSGSIAINGSAVTVTTTVPGQNALVSFDGASGQQATVRITGNSMGNTGVSLRKPDGSTLTSSSSSSTSFNLATQTLPIAGTYTIFINPSSTNTGSMTVSVTNP